MRMRFTIVVLFLLAVSAGAAEDGIVWWEAEDFAESSFPARHAFDPGSPAEAEKLSGGRWIGADGDHGEMLSAEYVVRVPRTGEWSLWVRKFWKHGPFRWRFDDGDWSACGRDVALADEVQLRTHVVASWVFLGRVSLEKGKRRLRIELAERRGAACFDCFVLAEGAFFPRGKLRPGEKLDRAPEGWFAFEPGPDPFGADAVDLRSLNDERAGERGFLTAAGDEFLFEDDEGPVRFWAVNASPDFDDHAHADHLARKLAKLGVNMVRIHRNVFEPGNPAKVDPKVLDRIHYFVAAPAREGIYTKLSIYFPLGFKPRAEHGFPGHDGKQSAFGLLFFHPRMREIYLGWLEQVLRSENPYSGKTLAEDPALAIFEIVNEDNLFFWTFRPHETIPAESMRHLEAAFGRDLAEMYGSLEKAVAGWDGRAVKGDAFDEGRAGLLPAWHMTGGAPEVRSARVRDQVGFLWAHQREFYEWMVGHLRKEIGLRCCISATNWVTADGRLLGALDKETNLACDVIDRHAYFGGKHEGEGASYSLRTGHRYTDRTALRDPAVQPVREVQYGETPHIVSEYDWPMPNRFRAEAPFLAAVYGALQGTDGFFHFAVGGAEWDRQHRKFSVATPVTMGQFPALAMLYRRGYLKEAPVVSRTGLDLGDLFGMKGSPAPAPQSLDALRAAQVPKGGERTVKTARAVDPLAFFVGRVFVDVNIAPDPSLIRDLSAFIDRKRGVVRSVTGELVWDYGRGLVTVDAPKAQGALGFLRGAGRIRLSDLEIEVGFEYGAVLAVSLDDRPLETSKRILLQVTTEDANFGFETKGGPERRITSLGAPPIVVRSPTGEVLLHRRDAARLTAVALDGNLAPTPHETRGAAGHLKLRLRPDTLHYLIHPRDN